MQVRIACLADYASISMGDKLNIMGVFSQIMAHSEPIVHMQMQLVVQLQFEPAEAGKKQVRILLRDEDGKELLSLGGEITVPRATREAPAVVNQILVLNNVTFPHFGRYEFWVLLNDRLETTIPVAITRAREPDKPQLVA